MVRTMMVAAETYCAAVVMFPYRLIAQSAVYIMCGTYVFTNATFHTAGVVNMEWLVGDEIFCKETSYQMRVNPGPPAFMEAGCVVLSFFDNANILVQFVYGLLLFGPFLLYLVDVHER